VLFRSLEQIGQEFFYH